MQTQNDMILRYLSEVGSITPVDALREFGCMRLGARIWDLKKAGQCIDSEVEHSINRFGKRVSFARYVMRDNAEAHGRAVARTAQPLVGHSESEAE